MKIEVRGDYSPMEEDFFQQNDFLCEMALQNQFNYCLKIRKLKLRVTIQKLEPILYEYHTRTYVLSAIALFSI